MPKITKIEVQKKTKNVLIFLDEQFEMGIDIDTLVKFNLKKGNNLKLLTWQRFKSMIIIA